MSLNVTYDRAAAGRALAEFRAKRRSVTPEVVVALCRALSYRIDTKRGKGSHAVALRQGAPTITIPKNFGVRIATGILTTLEEVFERDGELEQRNG
ncbi:MAG: hypothetical protein ACYCS7_13040 [Acidimicrobiales bacterium]